MLIHYAKMYSYMYVRTEIRSLLISSINTIWNSFFKILNILKCDGQLTYYLCFKGFCTFSYIILLFRRQNMQKYWRLVHLEIVRSWPFIMFIVIWQIMHRIYIWRKGINDRSKDNDSAICKVCAFEMKFYCWCHSSK